MAHVHPSTPKTQFGYLPQVPHLKGGRRSSAAPGHSDDARWQTLLDDCVRFRTIDQCVEYDFVAVRSIGASGRRSLRTVVCLLPGQRYATVRSLTRTNE